LIINDSKSISQSIISINKAITPISRLISEQISWSINQFGLYYQSYAFDQFQLSSSDVFRTK